MGNSMTSFSLTKKFTLDKYELKNLVIAILYDFYMYLDFKFLISSWIFTIPDRRYK